MRKYASLARKPAHPFPYLIRSATQPFIQHGDQVDFLLPDGHSWAFGLTVTSGDPLLADDLMLVTADGQAGNSPLALGPASDGGQIYFLGLVSSIPLNEVALRYGDSVNHVAFLYTIDAITLALGDQVFHDRFEALALD